jgi:hypothetical protein
MSQVLALPVVTDVSPLCRSASQACVACCRGDRMSRERLTRAMDRQSRLFALAFGSRTPLPSRLALMAFELWVRRGWPLIVVPFFLIPGIGALVRARVARRMCCTFLGSVPGDPARPGCLLHPSRWAGVDVRRSAAFALLPGMRCGEPGYVCQSAALYRNAGPLERRRFRERTCGMDWFEFGNAVERSLPDFAFRRAGIPSEPPAQSNASG